MPGRSSWGYWISLLIGWLSCPALHAQVSPPEYTCYIRYDHDAAGNRTAKYWYCCCGAETSGTEPDTTGGQKTAQVDALLDGIDLQLQPNPATDRLIMALNTPLDAATVEVYGLHGQKVSTTTLHGDHAELDLRGYPAGPYLLRLIHGREMIVKQFIVQ